MTISRPTLDTVHVASRSGGASVGGDEQQTCRLWMIAFLAVAMPVFFLFTHNSGYGYDQLEYLVIGRLLARGHSLYEYAVSKSPGIYYLTAGLQALGVPLEHLSLAAVITGIWALTTAVTYAIFARWHAPRLALAAACLTGLSGFFCELNFLQPTAFFYLTGLLAYDQSQRFAATERISHAFLAGAWIAAGVLFKTSSLFYGPGAAVALLVLGVQRRRPLWLIVVWGAAMACGAVVVLALQYAVAWACGVGEPYLRWTYLFPLQHYPANTRYLSKLYAKLLWVHLVIGAGMLAAVMEAVRRRRRQSAVGVIELGYGLSAYIALLKTQASHYAFAGIPFLLMFAVAALEPYLLGTTRRGAGRQGRKLVLVAAGLAATMLASILWYRPSTLQRLTTVRDYAAGEKPIRDFLQRHVAPSEFVLLTTDTTHDYWVSDRFPPPPFINMDVKSIWYLRNEPERIYSLLDNPRLTVVQFDDYQVTAPRLEDDYPIVAGDAARMRDFRSQIESRFDRLDETLNGRTFWKRKP